MAKGKEEKVTLYHPENAPDGQPFDPRHAKKLMAYRGGTKGNGGWTTVKPKKSNAINEDRNTREDTNTTAGGDN